MIALQRGSACALVAFLVGAAPPVLAQVDEIIVDVTADSFNYAGQALPHGDMTFMPIFTDNDDGRVAVSMFYFDLSDLDLVGDEIVDARIELTVGAARQDYNLLGDSGIARLYQREELFDETEQDPDTSSIGDPLVELTRFADDESLVVLEGAGLTDLVSLWVDEPTMNAGLDLAFDVVDGNNDTFWFALRTKEWANGTQQPQLIISTIIPGPATGLMIGAGWLAARRRRSA
jgi:hypothetical protein